MAYKKDKKMCIYINGNGIAWPLLFAQNILTKWNIIASSIFFFFFFCTRNKDYIFQSTLHLPFNFILKNCPSSKIFGFLKNEKKCVFFFFFILNRKTFPACKKKLKEYIIKRRGYMHICWPSILGPQRLNKIIQARQECKRE